MLSREQHNTLGPLGDIKEDGFESDQDEVRETSERFIIIIQVSSYGNLTYIISF